MRWQEEVTLITYEMQWTARYFAFKSKTWSELANSSADQILVNAGSLAYAKRKQSTWRNHCIKTDRIFTLINNAYKSPL
jgi:hypothetical protein